jgi:hypothetical protein
MKMANPVIMIRYCNQLIPLSCKPEKYTMQEKMIRIPAMINPATIWLIGFFDSIT